MGRKSININDYNKVSPSGVCRMGETNVTYYHTNGGRLWFDKLAIEKVLTGKNQHNLLGQYKDPRNHGVIFDTDRKAVVAVINKTGVNNYLRKAWSVKDENRHDFYTGVKELESPKEKKVTEPLQIPMFNVDVPVSVNPFVKISEVDGQYNIDYTVGGKSADEKKQNLAKMLISAANSIMTGNTKLITLKEVA